MACVRPRVVDGAACRLLSATHHEQPRAGSTGQPLPNERLKRGGSVYSTTAVFQIDHPASQEMKRIQLERIGGKVLSTLTLVPVDFETERLDDTGRRSGLG